jgi:hypothetical protein
LLERVRNGHEMIHIERVAIDKPIDFLWWENQVNGHKEMNAER